MTGRLPPGWIGWMWKVRGGGEGTQERGGSGALTQGLGYGGGWRKSNVTSGLHSSSCGMHFISSSIWSCYYFSNVERGQTEITLIHILYSRMRDVLLKVGPLNIAQLPKMGWGYARRRQCGIKLTRYRCLLSIWRPRILATIATKGSWTDVPTKCPDANFHQNSNLKAKIFERESPLRLVLGIQKLYCIFFREKLTQKNWTAN